MLHVLSLLMGLGTALAEMPPANYTKPKTDATAAAGSHRAGTFAAPPGANPFAPPVAQPGAPLAAPDVRQVQLKQKLNTLLSYIDAERTQGKNIDLGTLETALREFKGRIDQSEATGKPLSPSDSALLYDGVETLTDFAAEILALKKANPHMGLAELKQLAIANMKKRIKLAGKSKDSLVKDSKDKNLEADAEEAMGNYNAKLKSLKRLTEVSIRGEDIEDIDDSTIAELRKKVTEAKSAQQDLKRATHRADLGQK